MTLFKEAVAPNVPAPPPFPAGGCGSLGAFNTRDRMCLQGFLNDIQTRTGHAQSVRLWNRVLRFISVGGAPNYTVTPPQSHPAWDPTNPPPNGMVLEAGILFSMWCLRDKLVSNTLRSDPDDGIIPDPEEMDPTRRTSIVTALGQAITSNGYTFLTSATKRSQFYQILDPDTHPIQNGVVDDGSTVARLEKYQRNRSKKRVIEAFQTILSNEIDNGSRCFYSGYFADATLFMGSPQLMASGDGGATTGLMGISGGYGQIFFGYNFEGTGRRPTVTPTTNAVIQPIGANALTTIHLAIDGLDFPNSGIDPGYEVLATGTTLSLAQARARSTLVAMTINNHRIRFRANRRLPTLTPINLGDCFIIPVPTNGQTPTSGPNYTFVSRRTGLVIAQYNENTGDLVFTDLVNQPINVIMRSGSEFGLEEAILYVGVVQLGGAVNVGLTGLFNPDKFELDLAQKGLIQTNLLSVVAPGRSNPIGTELITSIQDNSNAAAIIAGNQLNLATTLTQGLVSQVVSNTPLIVNTNPLYAYTLPRGTGGARTLERSNALAGSVNRRASMAGIIIAGNNITINISSFVDESWSRLDRKVVGVVNSITEPRQALITDRERVQKLRTLDFQTEYGNVNRPVSSTATNGRLSTYVDVGGTTTHPPHTLTGTGGAGIAFAANQVTGFIPSYNPVLAGLRSIGVIEAMRDLLAVQSNYDYYVFRALHEALLSALVLASPLTTGTVRSLGLVQGISNFDYQTFKWYDTGTAIHDIPAYHAGGDQFTILVPPGNTQNSPNGGAYPNIPSGTSSEDVYLVITKNGTVDGDNTVNSSYSNNTTTDTITVTLTDPNNDSFIAFYDDMDNPLTRVIGGRTATVDFRLYTIPDSTTNPASATPFQRNGLAGTTTIVGVGGVAKFGVGKATAGTVTITVTQVGGTAITTSAVTMTFT